MNDNGTTQVLERPEVQAEAAANGSGGGTANTAATAGGSFPRRWFAFAVVAVLLLLAGVGVLLATSADKDVVASSEVAVPDLRGMTLDRAGEEVLAAGLQPGTVTYAVVEESVTPSGTVLSQDPLPGALVDPDTAMDIVLARGPAAPAGPTTTTTSQTSTQDPQSSTSSGSSSSGSGSGTTPPDQPPALPDVPPAESIDISKVQPRIVDPGVFKLLEPTYKTLLHHSQSGGDWQSPGIVFGDKPKRVSITADGPLNNPIAVWSWGPNDSDWTLENVSPSGPGATEGDEHTGTFTYDFEVGAGVHTILVRPNYAIVWWAVKIEEQQ